MNENLFENKNYLKKDNENILEIKNENVSLIKQLLTTIKDEPDLNNKKIMFDKLMTHLKINLEFKDLDFLQTPFI
jgi:DNA-binding transcriptional regulator WhiA